MTRNGSRPVIGREDLDSFAGEIKREDSSSSSAMLWVPGNGNSKKIRAEPVNGSH